MIVEGEAVVAADLSGKIRQMGYAVAGWAATGMETVALVGRVDMVGVDLMTAHHYPLLEAQLARHRAFREKIIRFCIEWACRDTTLPGGMLSYLRDWWVHHILEEDRKYAAFFQERGVS